MKPLRSLSAVVVGFVLFADCWKGLLIAGSSLADSSPMGFLFLSAGWTAITGIVAGYIAAVIGGRNELAHAAGIGLLIVIPGIVAMSKGNISRPDSYFAVIACGPISLLIGAAIRRLTRASQTANSNTSGAASRR